MIYFQIGTLLTSLVVQVMIITSLTLATPLLDLFGPTGCDAFNFVTTAHNVLIVTGGFTMAIFRLICVQFQSYVNSLEGLMVRLMWIQFVIFLGGLISVFWGLKTYGSSSFTEFCNGYTTKVSKIIDFSKILSKMTLKTSMNLGCT